jgi:PleD family two-component response regulator
MKDSWLRMRRSQRAPRRRSGSGSSFTRHPVCPSPERGPRVTQILVIDDEAMIRTLLRAVLEREGYEVVEAVAGAAGLQGIRRRPRTWSLPTCRCR